MENEPREQNAKLDPEAANTLANSRTQPETPGMTGQAYNGAALPKNAPQAAAHPENVGEQPATTTPYTDRANDPSVEVTYGGNFGNSTQPVYHDDDRRENQLSGPGRGEFGSQDMGTTQGGYGAQYRADDVYGGQLGAQPIDTGGYRGGRPEHNTGTDEFRPEGSTFGTEPGTPQSGTTVDPHYTNDNDSPRTGAGFSEDYGRTSLGGRGAAGGSSTAGANLPPDQRNQTEDYRPSQDGHDSDGLAFKPAPMGQRTTELGGHDEPGPTGEPKTDAETGSTSRTGYVATNGEASQSGSIAEGLGSRGGSYDDANANKNTGGASAEELRQAENNQAPVPPHSGDDSDYGTMPRRNAGRDTDADQ